MFSLRPVFKSSLLALLIFLVFLSSSVVVAQQQDAENATTLMPSNNGKNTDSSLLMTNYNALREEGQGFYLAKGIVLYKRPGTKTAEGVVLQWWCALEFSFNETTNRYGYVGQAVEYFLGSIFEDLVAQGAQNSFPNQKSALSVSAVLVPTLGIFEGQIHPTHDDAIFWFWDDGSATLPFPGWEGHDEGDTHPNTDTSAFSATGTITKITTKEVAKYLGMDVADMTPATCSMEYEATWNATHVPDPIDTSVTTLEENVAQLQANNKELLSRIVAIKGSLTPATSSSLPFMAWNEHATMDIVMKSSMTVAVIIGLVAIDFI